jgi:hypothetical protein
VLEQLCLAAEVRYGLHSCAQFYELCVIKRVTLWPPDVVRTAINKGIRLARYVDIGVAHLRAPEDLDWPDWLVAELGGLAQTNSIRLRPANRRSSNALAAARNCVDRSGYSLGFIEAYVKGKAASRRNRAGAFRGPEARAWRADGFSASLQSDYPDVAVAEAVAAAFTAHLA